MSDQLRINEILNRLNELKTPEVHALESELSVLRQEMIYEEDDPHDDEFYRSERYLERREESERYDDMLDAFDIAGING